MKKLVALLLALTMVFALAACGESGKPRSAARPLRFLKVNLFPTGQLIQAAEKLYSRIPKIQTWKTGVSTPILTARRSTM